LSSSADHTPERSLVELARRAAPEKARVAPVALATAKQHERARRRAALREEEENMLVVGIESVGHKNSGLITFISCRASPKKPDWSKLF
jgi:hypothetical protein